MNHRPLSLFVVVVIALVSSFSSLAQNKIDKLVAELEKDPKVQVTYTEKRDPQTKKITRQSTILNGNSKWQAEDLWKAFEQERTNSVSVTKTRNQSFIIKFLDKNYSSSYVLSVNGTSWSLVITKREANEDGDDPSWGFEFNSLDGLDFSGFSGLDQLSQLGSLESLNALNSLDGLTIPDELNGRISKIDISDGCVIVYDEAGNKIFSSQNVSKNTAKSVKNKAKDAAKKAAKSKSSSVSSSSSSGTRTVTMTTGDGRIYSTTFAI